MKFANVWIAPGIYVSWLVFLFFSAAAFCYVRFCFFPSAAVVVQPHCFISMNVWSCLLALPTVSSDFHFCRNFLCALFPPLLQQTMTSRLTKQVFGSSSFVCFLLQKIFSYLYRFVCKSYFSSTCVNISSLIGMCNLFDAVPIQVFWIKCCLDWLTSSNKKTMVFLHLHFLKSYLMSNLCSSPFFSQFVVDGTAVVCLSNEKKENCIVFFSYNSNFCCLVCDGHCLVILKSCIYRMFSTNDRSFNESMIT